MYGSDRMHALSTWDIEAGQAAALLEGAHPQQLTELRALFDEAAVDTTPSAQTGETRIARRDVHASVEGGVELHP